MTGNLLLDTLISLGAIAAMVAAVFVAFGNAGAALDEATARERLDFDEPDFEPIAFLMDEKGRAILAEGKAGDFAVVRSLGADLITRRFSAGTVKTDQSDGGLGIDLREPGLGKIVIDHPDAAHWARKCAGK